MRRTNLQRNISISHNVHSQSRRTAQAYRIRYVKAVLSDRFQPALSCALFLSGPFLLVSQDLVHLRYQSIAVDAVNHAGFFQGLSLRSRAAQAVHTSTHKHLRNQLMHIDQFADEHCLFNLHIFFPPLICHTFAVKVFFAFPFAFISIIHFVFFGKPCIFLCPFHYFLV